MTSRTYSSKRNRKAAYPPSSPISALSSSPVPVTSRKRAIINESDVLPRKRAKKRQEKQKALTQLHFCIDQPIHRTCPLCELSYTKGAPEDERLHRAHCTRVQREMEWGREEAREAMKAEVEEVSVGISLKTGQKGRVICIRATTGGKIGTKLSSLLKIVNTALSAPSLEPKAAQMSKVYLFLLPTTPASNKEKIAGCVVAQRIETAMAIVARSTDTTDDTSVFCDPKPLPTPMGVARIFVPKDSRRQGIARELLSVAARTFVQGCVLDPRQGQVAFTQTTGDGLALMKEWGGECMRIYEE